MHRPKDAARDSGAEAAARSLVSVHPLAEEGQESYLASVEIARNVGALTGHVHHLPAPQYLLDQAAQGDGRGH